MTYVIGNNSFSKFLNTNVPRLIWATNNPFPKILENKMENRSENTQARVLHPTLYLVFQNFRKCKTRPREILPGHVLSGRIICLVKSKLIIFKYLFSQLATQKII